MVVRQRLIKKDFHRPSTSKSFWAIVVHSCTSYGPYLKRGVLCMQSQTNSNSIYYGDTEDIESDVSLQYIIVARPNTTRHKKDGTSSFIEAIAAENMQAVLEQSRLWLIWRSSWNNNSKKSRAHILHPKDIKQVQCNPTKLKGKFWKPKTTS